MRRTSGLPDPSKWFGAMRLRQGPVPCFQPPFPSPVQYLKGPEEQVKFPGLDVQRQPTDKECPHLEKKKGGSWGPSLIPNMMIHHASCSQRDNASPRGTSWADKSLKSCLSDAEFLGGVSPFFRWSWRKLLRHHGRVRETCPHPTKCSPGQKARRIPAPSYPGLANRISPIIPSGSQTPQTMPIVSV